MTVRERLQIIGQALRGRSQIKEVVKEINRVEKAALGSFLNWRPSSLSDEKRVSSKVLEANKGWVYRNNDVIAKEVAGIEFELYTTRLVGGQVEFVQIDEHPLLDALDRFNEFTDASSGFYTTQSHRKLAGDAFWFIDGNGPNVSGIYILQPDKITLELGKVARGQRVIEAYQYEDTVDGTPIKETYKPENVIHFKVPNPKNPYRGLGAVEAAADAIDTDTYAIEANKKMFERGLIANFILTTPNKVTTEQLQQLHAEMKSSFQGVENAFKVPIFGSDLKPVTTQMNNKEMEFIAQQEWVRDKIASIFGNNKAVLGVTDDVNRANAEATIENWKQTTITQEMKAICDTLNEFFVPRFGTNLILGFCDPVPEDKFADVADIKVLLDGKVITQNEARELIGYDPSPEEGADLLRQPMPEVTPQLEPPVPKSLQNVNLKRFLRNNHIYQKQKQFKEIEKIVRPVAEKIVKSRKKHEPDTPVESREHVAFTNEQVWDFHNKQIHVVEAQEKVFSDKVERYVNGLVERMLQNVPDEVAAMQRKALLNEEDEVARAVLDFAPILNEVALLSGQQALQFISDDSVYMAFDIRATIEANVRKFASSMIQTDRDKMIDIIAQGIANGESVDKIRRNIVSTFAEYSKVQAERVTRTEVIRTSNLGTMDAWKQSGVVEGKQWLTAMDDRVDPLCAYMNGKIIMGLSKNYFDKGETLEIGDHKADFSYGSVKTPPLHPNCRCTLLPVLIGENAFDAEAYLKIKGLELDKQELEEKIDKRTKNYRKLKERNLELEQYVKELEGLVDEELKASETEG